MDQDERTVAMQVLDLQRTFVPPPELAGSSPRDVTLTAGGKFLYVVAVLLFAGALTAGLLLNQAALSQKRDRQAFAADAVSTTGEVTRLWRRSDDSKEPWVSYRFTAPTGEYEGQSRITLSAWQNLRVGSPLDVGYLPRDPTRNLPAGTEPRAIPAWVPIVVAISLTAGGAALLLALNRQRRLLADGRPAPAIVTTTRRLHTSHGGSYRSIRYTFPLLSGAIATGRSDTSRKAPGVGTAICIVYDPDRPLRSQPYPFQLVRPTKLSGKIDR